MKKFVLALALVTTFSLSTNSVYADELKMLSYTEVESSYEVEEELLLGDGIKTVGLWSLGIGAVTALTGIILMCTMEDMTTGLIVSGSGLALAAAGAVFIGVPPSALAYSEVENNSAFKLCEISAPKQDDFNWAPIIASDFNGNMNYGAAMAYRF